MFGGDSAFNNGFSGLALALVVIPIIYGASFIGAPIVVAIILRNASFRHPFLVAILAGVTVAVGFAGVKGSGINPLLALLVVVAISLASYMLLYGVLSYDSDRVDRGVGWC